MGPRMTTLHEEHGHSMSPLEDGDEDELSDKENTEMDSSDGNKTLTPKTIENSPKTVEPVELIKEDKKIETDCKVEEWKENSRHRKTTMTSSRTLDSLSDIQIQGPKMGTPSTSSSGYGSAAVSTSNLLSEDSLSVRSISVDESPEVENKSYVTDDSIKNQTETLCKLKIDEPQRSSPEGIIVDNSSNLSQINDSNILNNNRIEHKDLLTVEDSADGVPSPKSVSGDESPNEGSSVVQTKLPPGKVSLSFESDFKVCGILIFNNFFF